METFRIEVGRDHQVKPGNIVGAIANEAGLNSSGIGRIEIYDQFSTVDLLVGMPRDTFESLQRVIVAGRPLNISRVNEASAPADRTPAKKLKPRAKKAKPVAVKA
jgi:ATP-dependent RNA helicase DeaD